MKEKKPRTSVNPLRRINKKLEENSNEGGGGHGATVRNDKPGRRDEQKGKFTTFGTEKAARK